MFFHEPATWALFLVMGTALIARRVTRAGQLALICYTLGYALSAAYMLADDYAVAISLWQSGLLLMLVMYVFAGSGPWMLIAGSGAGVLYLLGISDRYVFEFILAVLIAVASFRIFCRVGYSDPYAKMAWLNLTIAEVLGATLVGGCKFFIRIDMTTISETWGNAVEKSVCAEAFGQTAAFLPIIVTLPFLAWISLKWNWTRYSG